MCASGPVLPAVSSTEHFADILCTPSVSHCSAQARAHLDGVRRIKKACSLPFHGAQTHESRKPINPPRIRQDPKSSLIWEPPAHDYPMRSTEIQKAHGFIPMDGCSITSGGKHPRTAIQVTIAMNTGNNTGLFRQGNLQNLFDTRNTKPVLWSILVEKYKCDMSLHPKSGRRIGGYADLRRDELLTMALFTKAKSPAYTRHAHWDALRNLVALDRASLTRIAEEQWNVGGSTKNSICMNIIACMKEQENNGGEEPVDESSLTGPPDHYTLAAFCFAGTKYCEWLDNLHRAGGSKLPTWGLESGEYKDVADITQRSLEALKYYSDDSRRRMCEKNKRYTQHALLDLKMDRSAALEASEGDGSRPWEGFAVWRKLQQASMSRMMATLIS